MLNFSTIIPFIKRHKSAANPANIVTKLNLSTSQNPTSHTTPAPSHHKKPYNNPLWPIFEPFARKNIKTNANPCRNESGIEIARILYEKASSRNLYILAPELLIYEVLNIFRFRTNISEKLLEDIIREIFNILILLKLDDRSYIRAYGISRKIEASIYDCIYIAMSEIYKAPLITADKKLYESAKNLNLNVVLLDDFSSFWS